MKIAIRAGHNFSVPGAKGIIEETKEARNVKNAVIKYLKLGGAQVFDVTPDDSYNSVGSDLAYGVNKANSLGVDLFVSCHFNNAYKSYDGALGTEVWTYNGVNGLALRVVNNIASLGFNNRGVKQSRSLYELRRTNMQAMIIEVCFVEATKDVKLYRKLGADKIGKKIAEAILSKNIEDKNTNDKDIENTNTKPDDREQLWEISISGTEVKDLQTELNRQFNAGLKVDGYFGEDTLNACVTVKSGAKGNLTKLIQKRLINKGYDLSPYGADGDFGSTTANAVKKLQKDKGIKVDGIVTKDTWKALYAK